METKHLSLILKVKEIAYAIEGDLLLADVVRLDGSAGLLGSLGNKAAASKEIDEGWKSGAQEAFTEVEYLEIEYFVKRPDQEEGR